MCSQSTSPPKGKGRRTKPTDDDWTIEQLYAFNAGETIPEWEETDAQHNLRITSELNSQRAKLQREVARLFDLQSGAINTQDMIVPYVSYNMYTGAEEFKVRTWDHTLKYIPLIATGGKSLGAPRFDGNFTVPEVGRKPPAGNIEAVNHDMEKIYEQDGDAQNSGTGASMSSNHSTSPDGTINNAWKGNNRNKRTATQADLATPASKKRRSVDVTPSPFTLRSTRGRTAAAPAVMAQTVTESFDAFLAPPAVITPTLTADILATLHLVVPDSVPTEPIRKSLLVILKLPQRRQQRLKVLLPATARFLITASRFPISIPNEQTLIARWNSIADRPESDWAVAKREILMAPVL
jgi:hypothetical protein